MESERFSERSNDAATVLRAPRALQSALSASYALVRELGSGGMATVYLARDVRHGRAVAVKVLHPELSAALGPERFLREIELTASLQHPHILPLFDSGEAGGLLFYVMPYVEGETLRARLARERQLPVDEAVRLAREVAEALAYAHSHGVIHRDVKPENILLQGRDHPHALVADFGIALAVAQAGGARMTQTGLSLGTPQYMAPEQAMGERGVDARADVYALGCVLYEMLAGEPPFTGPTAQAVVARVLTEEPKALPTLRPSVPAHVDRAVHTALEKLPADRVPSAAAFAAALTPPPLGAPPAGTAALGSRAARPRAATAVLAAGALATGVMLGWGIAHSRGRTSAGAPAAERGPVRFVIDVDSGVLQYSSPAISPDGRTIVYAVNTRDGARLHARALGELGGRPLPGTEGAERPFFSPDGAWVAFHSHGAIRKIRLAGGSPVLVTEVRTDVKLSGGWWGDDDAILYAVLPRGVLYRVPASGGTSLRIPVADTSRPIAHPQALPGGRAILVTTLRDDYSGPRVAVLDLASGRLREFAPGSGARYVAGKIFYVGAGGQLYRQAFDAEQPAPRGEAEEVVSGIDAVNPDDALFAVSAAGVLAYHSSRGSWALTLTDRAGRALHILPARRPWSPRFAPDGRRVAYGAHAPGRDSSDVWVTDLSSATPQRLTSDARANNDPQWSPDGRRIAHQTATAGGTDLVVRTLDGAPEQTITSRPGYQWTSDWLRDGSALLFTDVSLAGDMAIWVQPMDDGPARPYLTTPARESGARASPDGRWVAYTSDETGRNEVYVQSYPVPRHKTLVSAGGGVNPVWRGDGRELYYWQGEQLVAASVDAAGQGEALSVRRRLPLFRAPYVENVHANYDVSPDGSRFVVVTRDARAARLVIALDALGTARTPERGLR